MLHEGAAIVARELGLLGCLGFGAGTFGLPLAGLYSILFHRQGTGNLREKKVYLYK